MNPAGGLSVRIYRSTGTHSSNLQRIHDTTAISAAACREEGGTNLLCEHPSKAKRRSTSSGDNVKLGELQTPRETSFTVVRRPECSRVQAMFVTRISLTVDGHA